MIGGKLLRHQIGSGALGAGAGCFLLGFQACRGLAARIGFVVGATARLARRLAFRRHAGQRGSLSRLVVAQAFVREIRCTALGLDPLPDHAFEFLFLARPGTGRRGQFRRCKFAALGIRQRPLFRLDPGPQRNLGQPLDVGLLRGGGLGRAFGRRAIERLLGRKSLGLLTALCGGDVFGSHQLARLGGGARALVRGSQGQRLGSGGTLGVRRIGDRRGDAGSELPALLFGLHQSRQKFAQAALRTPGEFPEDVSLTQAWRGPKVE